MICIISPMYEILIKINQWKYMDIVKSCFNFQMKIKINFPKYTFIRHSHSSVSRDNFCNFSRAGLFKVLKSVKNKKKKNKIIKKDSDSLYHRKIARLKSSPFYPRIYREKYSLATITSAPLPNDPRLILGRRVIFLLR